MTLNGFEESVELRAGYLFAVDRNRYRGQNGTQFGMKEGIFFHNYLARFDSLPAHSPAENGLKIQKYTLSYSIFDVLFVIVIYIHENYITCRLIYSQKKYLV